MKVGDADVTLKATVAPDNATDKAVTWSSNKESVATVTNGVVHAVGEGTATITAKAGDQTATCTVTVKVPYTAQDYKERLWDGTKVDSVKKTATSPTEIANDYTGTIASGWYTVTGDNVVISGNQTLTDNTYLILCDGAKLTINNGKLDGNGHNLYIYGQEEGTGQLVVTNNTSAIFGSNSSGTIEIHGGVITATSTSAAGLSYHRITMYGGKLNATGNMMGIGFDSGNFDLYGGEVVAKGTTNGIEGGVDGGKTLTVYGSKVQATGGTGNQAIYAKIKSGTSDIMFYFSTDGTTWDGGASYASATDAPNKRYAKVE